MQCTQLLSQSLSLCLHLSQLHSLLLQILCKLLLGAVTCDNTLAVRDKIVTSIAGLHVHNVILVTQANDVLFQYNFHVLSSRYYFIKSVTKGSRARWRARFTA